ncbi:hypothetical protein M3Y98_00283500 [Aphelenchoides besseyi]|nr:hypothetical protein M3Y98_00283500 [Aphelenchoides besseyi]
MYWSTVGLVAFLGTILAQLIDDSFRDHQYLSPNHKSSIGNEVLSTDDPTVQCTTQHMELSFQMTKPFHGRIYVEGREHDERCTAEIFGTDTLALNVRFPILACAIIEEMIENPEQVAVWIYVRVNFHKTLITGMSKVFRSSCSGLTKTEVLDDAIDRNTNTICRHKLQTPNFPYRVGGVIFHEWTCVELLGHRNYVMTLQDCVIMSKTKSMVQLVEHGRIIDESLISNLHGAEANGIKKFTAISQIFKFPGETEIRFRCQVEMIPQHQNRRLLIVFPNNGTVETSTNSNAIPTIVTTLTDWIDIKESLQAEEVFGGPEANWAANDGSLLSLDDLYESKEKTDHGLNLATDARAELLTSQEVPSFTKTAPTVEKSSAKSNDQLPTEHQSDSGEQVFRLYNNGIFDVTGNDEWLRVGKFNHEWRLDDLLLNRTDESLRIVACTNTSKFNVTVPLRNKLSWCSFRLLNNFLLIWSIFSVLIWIVLLARRIYRHMMKEYDSRTSHIGFTRQMASSRHLGTLITSEQPPYNTETNDYWRKNAF